MYFLGATELLSVKILMPSSYFSPEALMSVHSQRSFCTATYPLGACFLSIVQRWEVVCISEVDNVLFLWQNQSGAC